MGKQIKHTPGPWTAEYGEVTTVLDVERGRICTMNYLRGPHGSFGRRTNNEGEANARLIAAAPEMLQELKSISHQTRIMIEHFNRLQLLISKAEDVQP